MKRARSRLHRLSALATSTVLLLLASTLSFTSPAAAFSLCESAGSDTDGDGYGWENQQTCLVPWETHDLLKSLSPQPFSQADGKSVDDALHWHFGRVANLTARPLGELVDQAGNVETEFNNFGDDQNETRVFEDASGTEWVLQPPALSRFHQPPEMTYQWARVLSAEGLLLGLTEPRTPDQYPMRKFVTRPTTPGGHSFELVIQPDNLGRLPYTYNEQKVLTGNLGGTFNYSDADVFGGVLHLTRDIRPHDKFWFGLFNNRPGNFYTPLASDDHVIRPEVGESDVVFSIRSQRIVDNLNDIGKAARGEFGLFDPSVSHDLQQARGTDGVTHYLLRPPNGGDFFNPVIAVRPELHHVVEAYFAFNGVKL